MASTPVVTARRASSASRTPLTISFPGQRSRTQATSFQVIDGSNWPPTHSESSPMPRSGKKDARLPSVRRLPNNTPAKPARTHEDFPRIGRRQSRRNGESVLRVAAPQRLQGQIEREHECGAARFARTRDQRLVESAIAHEIQLEPEVAVHRCTHVFDRADGHGAQAERHAGRLRGSRRLDLAVPMKEPGEPGRRQRDGHLPWLAEHGGGDRKPRHVDHDALTQLYGAQVVAIARPRQLVVGAAVDVVEQGARNAPARDERAGLRWS